MVLLHKRREPKFVRYDVNNLLANRDVKEAYQATLGNEMVKLDKSGDPNQQLIRLFDSIKRSAEAEIGVKKPQQKQHYTVAKTISFQPLLRKRPNSGLNYMLITEPEIEQHKDPD